MNVEIIDTYSIGYDILEIHKYIDKSVSLNEFSEETSNENIKEKYNIFFSTSNSHSYCYECRPRHSYCICNDSDWLSGLWDGYMLLSYDDSYINIFNIYQYLKLHFEILINFDRMELKEWLHNNLYIFLNKYYEKEYTTMKELLNYYYKIGIFSDFFFEQFKEIYIKKYKDISDIEIKFTTYLSEDLSIDKEVFSYDNQCSENIYDMIQIILPNKMIIEFDDKCLNIENEGHIKSLFNISYETISYIKSLIDDLHEPIDKYTIFSGNSSLCSHKFIISSIDEYEGTDFFFEKCRNVLCNYYQYDIHEYSTLLKEYMEKNSINPTIFLDKTSFYDLDNKINDIKMLWYELLSNC